MSNDAKTNQRSEQTLPITRDLTIASRLSYPLAFLMTAASLGGLWFSASVYPTEELRQSFLANDVVNLLIGVPILLGCTWLARRGNLVGLLCWPGAVLYSFYNYLVYLIGMPLGWLTLVFMALVLLSGYLMFALLWRIDWEIVKSQLAGKVPEKLSGVVLNVFGLLFTFLAVGVITEARTNQTPLGMPSLGLAVADILLSLFLVIGGVLLFQRRPLGYASGMGMLFAASALFIGVILVVIIQPVLTDKPFSWNDLIVLSGMALICFIPTGLFIRGVPSKTK